MKKQCKGIRISFETVPSPFSVAVLDLRCMEDDCDLDDEEEEEADESTSLSEELPPISAAPPTVVIVTEHRTHTLSWLKRLDTVVPLPPPMPMPVLSK